MHPRIDCDVDYETPAKTWTDGVFAALSQETGGTSVNGAATENQKLETSDQKPGEAEGWSKKNPFPARLLTNRLLNAAGSGKEMRHYEILARRFRASVTKLAMPSACCR